MPTMSLYFSVFNHGLFVVAIFVIWVFKMQNRLLNYWPITWGSRKTCKIRVGETLTINLAF
jgi:hypothetical protein